jgi:hypothetical protein
MAFQNKRAGENVQYNIPYSLSVNSIVTGITDHFYLNMPFSRMHQNMQDYPAHLSDIDDVAMYQVDNYERLKPF